MCPDAKGAWRSTIRIGEGIAELVSMVCAGAVTLRDAISIIQTYGQLATYEAIYEKLLKKKTDSVLRSLV
ncbi:hypothetical protein LSPH24S_08607 [Lysinibacillus sphaericus]